MSTVEVYFKNVPDIVIAGMSLNDFQNIEVESSLNTIAYNIIEKKSGRTRNICSIDGPLKINRMDVPERITDEFSDLQWLLVFSADDSNAYDFHIVLTFAKSIAQKYHGVVFSCEEDKIIWPKQKYKKVSLPKEKTRIDLIKLVWFFPMYSSAKAIAEGMIIECSNICPESLPHRYGEFEPLQNLFSHDNNADFLRVAEKINNFDSNFRHLFWEASHPFREGSLSCSSTSVQAEEGVGFCKLEFSFDSRVLQIDRKWSEKLKELFTGISRTLQPFFGAVYIIRKVIVGRKLWYDSQVEKSPFPQGGLWLGLPEKPTWLVWYGKPYMPYVQEALRGFITKTYNHGFFISYAEQPLNADELQDLTPRMPNDLVIKKEIPPPDLKDAFKYMAAGFTEITYRQSGFVVHPKPIKADFIPDF